MKSGIFSVLPWMTMAVTSNVGGWIADTLVTRGVSVTTVRKVMQSVRAVQILYTNLSRIRAGVLYRDTLARSET